MDLERQGLETSLRAMVGLLLLAGLLPFDFIGRDPIWPWHGLLDATPIGVVALLLPPAAAGWIAWLLHRRPGKLALAAGLLAALGVSWLVACWARLVPHPLGVYANLTDGLPALFGRCLWLLLAGLVLVAAGLRLAARDFAEPRGARPVVADPWPLARGLTAAGIALVLLFYLLPHRGAVPLVTLGAGIAELVAGLEGPEGAALLLGQVLSIGPLLLAAAAGQIGWRRPAGRGGHLAVLVIGFVPGLCLLVGLRNLPALPAYTLVHLRAAVLLLVVVAGGALGLAALLRAVWAEVPWQFGRISRADELLAAALSDPRPAERLERSLAELHPLPRWLMRRRLRLWRAAAAAVPGAGEADLSAVIRFLDRRRREECQAPPDRAPLRWPWWQRGRWPSAFGLALMAAAAGVSLWLADRPPPLADCAPGPDSPALREVFAERLPAAVVELNRSRRRYRQRAGYRDLKAALGRLGDRVLGLEAGLDALLAAGLHGRHRLHRIRRVRDRLNRSLRRQRVPYYLRSRLWPGGGPDGDRLAVLVYRVAACRRYRPAGGGPPQAVLELERVDRLGVIEGYMGVTEQEETFVTVIRDRLDHFVRQRLSMVAGRRDALGGIARRAAVRLGDGDFDPALGAAGPVGRALLEGLIRHELHHRWLGLDPDPPAALWAALPEHPEPAVRAVTAEVGAYLGELRTGPAYARLRLALMLDALGRPVGRRGSHGRARAFLLQRLLGPERPARRWTAAERWAAARRLEALADAELIGRIDRLHRRLFNTPAPVFERVPDRDLLPNPLPRQRCWRYSLQPVGESRIARITKTVSCEVRQMRSGATGSAGLCASGFGTAQKVGGRSWSRQRVDKAREAMGCCLRSRGDATTRGEEIMAESVYKIIELVGSSEKSWEEAARNAVETASKSLDDIRVAEVVELDMKLDDNKVMNYRTKVKVSFKYRQ
jgi:hypothetical protein